MPTRQEHIARLEEVVSTSTNPFVVKLLLTQLSEYNQPETNAQLPLLQTHSAVAEYLAEQEIVTYNPPTSIELNQAYSLTPDYFFGPIADAFNKLQPSHVKKICADYEQRGASFTFLQQAYLDTKTRKGATKRVQGVRRIPLQDDTRTHTQEAFEKHNPIFILAEVSNKTYLSAFVDQDKRYAHTWNLILYSPASQKKFINVEQTKKFLPAYRQALRKARKPL